MKPKMMVKMSVDVLMTGLYFVLLAYQAMGDNTHKMLGVILFVLFIIHNILNLKWYGTIFRGRYTAFCVLQSAIIALLFVAMICLMVSGIQISQRSIFAFLDAGYMSEWRKLHMASAYWGLILMSAHLGTYWAMVMGFARELSGNGGEAKTAIWLRVIAFSTALYGIYAFYSRDIFSKIFALYSYPHSFWNYDEFVGFFFLDCVAIMGLFICVTHYVGVHLRGGVSK